MRPTLNTTEDPFDDYYAEEAEGENVNCEYCGGDGGDPWNDGITECPECDGEGYYWWK
jgi:hypothetical protein